MSSYVHVRNITIYGFGNYLLNQYFQCHNLTHSIDLRKSPREHHLFLWSCLFADTVLVPKCLFANTMRFFLHINKIQSQFSNALVKKMEIVLAATMVIVCQIQMPIVVASLGLGLRPKPNFCNSNSARTLTFLF